MRFTSALCAALAFASSHAAFAQEPWEKARDAARADLVRFRQDADREVLERRARIAELRRELLATSDRAATAQTEATLLEARLAEATRAAESAQEALDPLESEVQAVTAAIEERTEASAHAAESRPAPATLQAVLDDLEKRIAEAGVVRADGKMIRVGDLQWIEVLPGDRAVIGRPGRTAPVGPVDVPGIAAVRDALAAGAAPSFIPVDPTGRLDLKPPVTERDLGGWFRAGGPVVLIIVILGGLGLLLGIVRLVMILLEPGPDAQVVERAREAVVAGDREGAARILRARRGSVHEALAEVVLVGEGTSEASREARIEQILLRTVGRFERFLHMLAVLAAVAPLLGLLGTVVGMIKMFDALAGGSGGGSHVEALSGGIGEALISTEAGLLFAIPLILLHAVISARADRLEAALEDTALQVDGVPASGLPA